MSEPKMIGDVINDTLKQLSVKAEEEPLNEYVLKIRKYLGFSQVLVGGMAGITPAHLSEFETKGKPITRVQKANLKTLFGIGKKATPTKPQVQSDAFLKTCTGCNLDKPHEEFYSFKRPDRASEYEFTECKKCSNARSAVNRAKRRAADKEVKEWMRAGETTQQRKSAP